MSSRSVPILSAATRRTLDRHIGRALQQRYGARGNLREVVQSAALELATHGTSRDGIRDLLVRSVQEHPRLYRWDRVSIVTGLSTSADLTRQMLVWADPAPAAEPALLATTSPDHGHKAPARGTTPVPKPDVRWLNDGGA